VFWSDLLAAIDNVTIYFTGADDDGDGIPDISEGQEDSDGDGVPNYRDVDSDGDDIPDFEEGGDDLDGDGVPNYLDGDSDGDDVLDSLEARFGSDPCNPGSTPYPTGDVNRSLRVDAADVQSVVNAAFLGIPAEYDCDLNSDGWVNAIDLQLMINAVLGIEP